jgi:outer membrane protein insertion porin family
MTSILKQKKNKPAKWLKFSFLFLFLAYSNTLPQPKVANFQILGISVEGNESADAATIIANTGLKIGNEIEIPSDDTRNAINRLWSIGIFEHVEIQIEKKIDNGVFLLIKVKEHPRVEEIVIIGNDEIDEDDIREKVFFRRGQTLKPQDIFRVESKIRDLYYEEGFLNTEIEHAKFKFITADTTEEEIFVTWQNLTDPSDEYETTYEFEKGLSNRLLSKIKNRLLLMYKIEEGDEVVVRKISFDGNAAFDDDDLKSEFDETTEARWWKFWDGAKFDTKKFEEDKELLANFYRNKGYRDFQVIGDSLSYSDDKKDLYINVSVYEGPQYKIRNITWEGNTVYEDEILSERLDFAKGDVYDYEKFNMNLRFNESQTDVSSLYQDIGYLGFGLEPKEEVVAADSIDLHIVVNEGNRFKVGKIDITGNERTKEKVVRRELFTIPGDYYSRNNIFRSIQQLANLQYFNVEKLYQTGVNPRPVNDSTVTLVYSVEEKSSDYLNASVGYSGSFGFSGAVGVTLTNFSIGEPFQLGGGQVMNFNWQFGVGNFYRTFTLGFTEPWFLDTPTLVGFDLFDTRQQYIYDLRQSGITFKVGRRLRWPDDFFYIQGKFRFQYNNVIDGRSFYAEGLTRQYTVGATLSRADIDNPIFPSRGSRVSLSGELSGGPLLPGNVDYYKLAFKTEIYKRLFNSNRIALYTSADIGYIDEIVKGTNINPFEYFFMGGNGLIIATTPLRGYDDRTVGPRNSNGDIIGGKVMTKYTIELRAALALEPIPIYLLAFAEAGNTFFQFNQADFFDLRRSAGIGARILINPIGLLGFDYGYGFDRNQVDGQDAQWLFHFQFGKGF